MSRRLAPASLLLGNFVVGTSVLAPTGMLGQLADGFHISVREASLLVTFGAIVLGVGTPIASALTSRMDRRALLGGSLLIVALAQLVSAFAPSFAALLALRLVMLCAAAPFTPQAASVASLLVAPAKRAGSIAFVFLGWSIAAAVGIPLVGMVADRIGFRWSYGVVSVLGLLSFALIVRALPAGLRTAPVALSTWTDLVRAPQVVRLLAITVLLTAGQFVVVTFLGPLLTRLAAADADTVGLVFAIFGLAGFVGNFTASRVVAAWGPYKTAFVATSAMAVGITVFALGHGMLLPMALGVGIWGLGFASTNSMQQARLSAAAPLYAGAAVALNSSSLYVGQAIGSALGGLLFARGELAAMGYASLALILGALAVLRSTRPRDEPVAHAALSESA
jgi:MFS transporter, DHA1 family, inner membrane transport protein